MTQLRSGRVGQRVLLPRGGRASGAGVRRGGFTFTEIMFAVVILGIGFIMVAGMLPVAIRLGQQSADETIAASTAQRVFQSIQSQATTALFPATAPPRADTFLTASPSQYAGATALPAGTTVVGYNAPFVALGEVNFAGATPVITPAQAAAQFNAFRADLVSSLDRTYGVALAYSRQGKIGYTGTPGGVSPEGDLIKVVAVVARVRDRSTFNDEDAGAAYDRQGKDVKIPGTAPADPTKGADFAKQYSDPTAAVGDIHKSPAMLQFKRLRVRFSAGANGAPDTISFNSSATNYTGDVSCVGPGAYVVVADVDIGGRNPCFANASGTSAAHGKVFRIGDFVDSGSTNPVWQLYIGYDLSTLPASERPPTDRDVEVLVLGKGLLDPTLSFNASTNPYTNLPLDVAVYTTTIGLRPQ